jgi:uncharacterized membrane protein YuzA (DUF378 family)
MIRPSENLEFFHSGKRDLSFVNALSLWGGMRKMHEMHNKDSLYIPFKVLTIIGAINWGFVGLLNFDLVAAIFGKKSFITRLIYTLVGLAGVFLIMKHREKLAMRIREKEIKGEKRYSGKQYSWSGIQ